MKNNLHDFGFQRFVTSDVLCSYFNWRCRKAYMTIAQGGVGYLLTNLSNLPMFYGPSEDKSQKQIFMFFPPILWHRQPRNHSRITKDLQVPGYLNLFCEDFPFSPSD